MEPVLTPEDSNDEAALAEAIAALRARLLANPPPPPEEVRRALDEIADTALALYGDDGRPRE